MSEQRDHVMRPDLPWRKASTTECGRSALEVASVISREDFARRLRKDGQQRTAILTCMTCYQTTSRWAAFADDPVDSLRREVYGGRSEEQFKRELRGLAALVEAHREEFDDFMSGLESTSDLAQQRLKRRRA